MDGLPRPHQEGVDARGESVDSTGFVKKYQLPVGLARGLHEMAGDFAFFTPAPLYLYGRFRDAPLADYAAAVLPADVRFYYHKFSSGVFSGLDAPSNGDRDWNCVLWAVHTRFWPSFADWMVSLALTYGDVGEIAGVGLQEFTVPDPLAVDKAVVLSGAIPTVTVAAFGINGSRVRYAFERDGVLGVPRLRRYNPDPEMRVFAAALYGGCNPVNARAVYRRIAKEGRNEDHTRRGP